ncbi:MAG: DCC1-like thiol-disulfide oxidoreductase family protein [Cyanobacteria bacterium P01_F01_bin.86]
MTVFGCLLLFIPWQTDARRRVIVVLLMGIHGFTLFFCKQPTLFVLLVITTWMVYLPRAIWEACEEATKSPIRDGLTIYYDIDCGFCKKVVHVLRTLLILPQTTLLTAQSDLSINQDMETHNSWVVVNWKQKRHYKFEAIAYVCSLSPIFHFLAPVLRCPPVMAVGTQFYKIIANNRKKAALFTRFLTFRTYSLETSNLENFVVGVLLIVFISISMS